MAGVATSPASPPSAPASARPSYAIRLSHVRTLLWLRLKLTLRGYARSWQRMLGLVVLLVFVLPFAGGFAFATALAYRDLPRAAGAQVLFAVVGGLYLLWAALPLLQYSLNEGLDVTKLQIYPLTRGEQMVSLVLSTLFDISTLFLLLMLAAILVGWPTTPLAAGVTVVALVAIYVHVVSLSQLMLAALMGLLRTRRFRDITVIVFALLGTVCSLGSQILARALESLDPTVVGAGGQNVLNLHLDRFLRWTPPGMATQAIVLADRGAYLEAIPWLAGSALLIPLMLAVWAWVLDRSITHAESNGGVRRVRRARGATSASASAAAVGGASAVASPAMSARRGLLPGAVTAIAAKDARYLWRDPQLKAALISVLFATIIVLFPNIYAPSPRYSSVGGVLQGSLTVLFAPLPALLVVLVFSQNALGMERQGLQSLLLLPVRPVTLLLGKNLFAGLFAFSFAVLLTIIRAAMTGGWVYVPVALVAGAAAVLVMLGCGNVTSVLAPMRWRTMRTGETSSYASDNGCLRSLLSLVLLAIGGLLLVPVALAVALPLILQHAEWLPFTLTAALLYSMALHQGATRAIAPVLLRRAPEILAVTVREG
jgi:ABC-2 type transport system permease protein